MRSASRFYQAVFMLLMGCLSIQSAKGAVWESKSQWTLEFEAKYSQWVKTHWTADVFTNPASVVYGLPTDCADAAYTMRATFSYLNQLPFAVKDPTGGSKPITNEMTRWDRQALSDKDKFIEFLKYVHNFGSSTTIAADSYPVLVNREWVRAGDILLRYEHHVYEIRDVKNSGRLQLIASTVPRDVRNLIQNDHFNASVSPLSSMGGIRAFREPDDLFKPEWKISGYSAEQFQFPKETYPDVVKSRLALVKETPDEELDSVYSRLCFKAKERAVSVNDALAYQAKIGGRCMNSTEFDDFSTTSRDKDLQAEFDQLKQFVLSHKTWDFGLKTKPLWKEAVKVVTENNPDTAPQMTKSFAFCFVSHKSGYAINLKEIRRRIDLGLLSDDPNAKLEARWGDDKAPASSNCPRY